MSSVDRDTDTVGSRPDGAGRLAGLRTLVVGASTGIGREIGFRLAREGARVGFAARRESLVQAAAAKVGDGAIAIACDVSDEQSCSDVVERFVSATGGLDALVYSPAIIAFGALEDLDASYWRDVLNVNVVGAALVTRAAIASLTAARGKALYVSSVSASASGPWEGLGAYITSKAALDKLVECWRTEHPTVAFTRLAVGPAATERSAADMEGARNGVPAGMTSRPEWSERWVAKGYTNGSSIAPEDLTSAVVTVLESQAAIDSVTIWPR